MGNLLTRTISGIVLVALSVGALLLSEYSMLGLILIIFVLGMFEFRKMFQFFEKALFSLITLAGAAFMIIAFLVLSQQLPNRAITISFILLLNSLLFYYLLLGKSSTMKVGMQIFLGLWLSASLSYFMALGYLNNGSYEPDLLLILIVLIWINDIGAYLAGSLFGKHPLAPAISPAKTWEGFISGILINALAGLFLPSINDSFNTITWVILAITVSLGATAGDLLESKIKREAGVKDSGNLIPGHGGILDRFDSMFFAAPLFYVIILFFRV